MEKLANRGFILNQMLKFKSTLEEISSAWKILSTKSAIVDPTSNKL